MSRKLCFFGLLVVLCLVWRTSANAILFWNSELLRAAELDAVPFYLTFRQMALFHNGLYNTLTELDCWKPGHNHLLSDCTESKVNHSLAYAAVLLLKHIHPRQALRAEMVARPIIRGGDSAFDWKARRAGERGALKALEDNHEDPHFTFVDYFPSGLEGRWEPTPPPFLPNFITSTGSASFFLLDESARAGIPPPPPPPLDSARFKQDVEEVRAIGGQDSTIRTQRQSELCHRWGGDRAVTTYEIAAQVVREAGKDFKDTATIFKLVTNAAYDAVVDNVYWKLIYDLIRPITVIQEGMPNLQPTIEVDSDWWSFSPTPPNSEFPCGTCTLGAALARLLERSLETDEFPFSYTLPSAFGYPVTVNFTGFSDVATMYGENRVWGGVHFRYSIESGRTHGYDLADAAFDRACPNRRCFNGPNREIRIDPQFQ
ncbi:hypothetical protein QOT17_024044 [Balamuthia mandrillaris]